MAVDFRGDTWKYVEEQCKKLLDNQLSVLSQTTKSYKELLLAQGQIQAIKTILNLSQPLAHTVPTANTKRV